MRTNVYTLAWMRRWAKELSSFQRWARGGTYIRKAGLAGACRLITGRDPSPLPVLKSR